MRYYVSWKTTGYYRKDSLTLEAHCPVSRCWPSCFFKEDSTLVHMHCACNTVQLLWHSRLPFSWTIPPNSPELNELSTRFRESCNSMSYESKRVKKSRSGWLNSGNALIQHLSEKMRFSCFPVLPGSAEAHVIWGGTVKRFFDCLLCR